MKPLALITFFLVMLCRNVSAQILPTLSEDFFVIEGDTIINSSIQLKEVVLFEPLRFNNYQEAKRYVILRERTFKVYPYAKIAADRLSVLTGRLEQIKSKRKRKVYLRRMEDFIYDEFEKELKKLSRSQGRILIKLVHRQTGITIYELIKELRTGLKALFYQRIRKGSKYEISFV